jgi:chemotaxis protein CheY-P-specific phosphatase CheC
MNQPIKSRILEPTKLTSGQLGIMREFLIETLDQAASAMGQMLRIRIKADLLGFGEGRIGRIQEFDDLGQFRVHVMKVALKGPIGGAFYFIINSHEVETINNVCLPKEVNAPTNSESRQIKFGFIAEIENMIAALATTEISEFLGVQLLGHVPEISVIQGSVVNDFLREEAKATNASFYVRSVLAGLVVEVSPHFIWMLDDEFKHILRMNS